MRALQGPPAAVCEAHPPGGPAEHSVLQDLPALGVEVPAGLERPGEQRHGGRFAREIGDGLVECLEGALEGGVGAVRQLAAVRGCGDLEVVVQGAQGRPGQRRDRLHDAVQALQYALKLHSPASAPAPLPAAAPLLPQAVHEAQPGGEEAREDVRLDGGETPREAGQRDLEQHGILLGVVF